MLDRLPRFPLKGWFLTMTHDSQPHDVAKSAATKYIDARVSLTWLLMAVIAIVSSYVMLQSRVSQLSDSISEMKQDRATWLTQNERVLNELRVMSATDAVQSNRIAILEGEVLALRRRSGATP